MRRTTEARELVEADDEVLMARFAAGHPEAFSELYERYERPVYGFCLRLLGDRDRAEDAFQDTFVTMLEQRLRYQDRGRFKSWLFTLARNVCLDRARQSVRRKRLLTLHAPSHGASEHEPDRVAELRDELTQLLASLPRDQREILLLHRYEGFSYAEIAGMTASTEVAVKQKAYRALLALRSRDGDGPDQSDANGERR